MKPIRLLLVVTAVAAILAVPAAAKEGFNIVTVAGPDWRGEIEITDPELLASLDMSHFLNLDRPIDAPAQVGRGYLVTRGYVEGAERHMFDRIVYFPGSPSYAYYLEIVNGAGPMDGNWYTVSEQGDGALAVALQKHGVRLPQPSAAGLIQPVKGPDGVEAAPPLGVGIAEFVEPLSLGVAEAIEAPAVGAPETVVLLAVAVLLGGLIGWVFRGMRQERIQPVGR